MGSVWANMFPWLGTDFTSQRPGSTSKSQSLNSRVWSGSALLPLGRGVVGEQRGAVGQHSLSDYAFWNWDSRNLLGRFSPLGDAEGLPPRREGPARGPTGN